MNRPQAPLERRCTFGLTLRFEPFFALEVVTDGGSRIHGAWSKRMAETLPRTFHVAFDRLGRASAVWPLIPDALEADAAPQSYDELRGALQSVPDELFRRRLVSGIVHEERTASALLKSGSAGLERTLARASGAKREWLAFVGLYPPRAEAPLAVALRLLLDDVRTFRSSVLDALDAFWAHGFARLWTRAKPDLLHSIEARQRLLAAVTFAEFAREALLRIQVRGRELRAIRGGYRIAMDAIAECRLVPSMFNDRRYWHAYDTEREAIVYFPYFEPSLGVPEDGPRAASPDIDPALVFRALGDATRYAMATLLARRPMSASDLSRALSLSKPTVSHHVGTLRDAGLLEEAPENGSVVLGLRRNVLENLSSLAVAHLFEARGRLRPHALPRSRRKA